jgi:hypothetical protein
MGGHKRAIPAKGPAKKGESKNPARQGKKIRRAQEDWRTILTPKKGCFWAIFAIVNNLGTKVNMLSSQLLLRYPKNKPYRPKPERAVGEFRHETAKKAER